MTLSLCWELITNYVSGLLLGLTDRFRRYCTWDRKVSLVETNGKILLLALLINWKTFAES